MKVLVILFILTSIVKLKIALSTSSSDPAFKYIEVNSLFNPEWLHTVSCAILIGDGLTGLFCGIFILFAI